MLYEIYPWFLALTQLSKLADKMGLTLLRGPTHSNFGPAPWKNETVSTTTGQKYTLIWFGPASHVKMIMILPFSQINLNYFFKKNYKIKFSNMSSIFLNLIYLYFGFFYLNFISFICLGYVWLIGNNMIFFNHMIKYDIYIYYRISYLIGYGINILRYNSQ